MYRPGTIAENRHPVYIAKESVAAEGHTAHPLCQIVALYRKRRAAASKWLHKGVGSDRPAGRSRDSAGHSLVGYTFRWKLTKEPVSGTKSCGVPRRCHCEFIHNDTDVSADSCSCWTRLGSGPAGLDRHTPQAQVSSLSPRCFPRCRSIPWMQACPALPCGSTGGPHRGLRGTRRRRSAAGRTPFLLEPSLARSRASPARTGAGRATC